MTSSASKRSVTRARERKEKKQHGRPLTTEERAHEAIAEKAQFLSYAHQRAIEFKGVVVSIRDEMVALLESFPKGRQHNLEREKLRGELVDFSVRVRGARAFVIDTGLALIDSIPDNPAEPPPVIETPPEPKIIVP